MRRKWPHFWFACALIATAMSLPFAVSSETQATVPASFEEGWAAYEQDDFPVALSIWSNLANSGNINAQVNLGVMYDYGKGVTQNHKQAARWYRAAADKGNAIAQYNLAILLRAELVSGDENLTAEHWLKQAASQGYEAARVELKEVNIPFSQKTSVAKSFDQYAKTNAYVEEPVSVGTAWPVAAGYAVTNHHVVAGKTDVSLILHDGSEVQAYVIGQDEKNDIAFLKVTGTAVLPPALPLSGQASALGASVFTIGFPRIDIMGKTPKLSQGIISGENGLRDDPTSYQISVPIQPGNSGGPLLNMKGEVVGMITAMLGQVTNEGAETALIPNINYAVKVDIIKDFLSEMTASHSVHDELAPVSAGLEDLASRVKNSVLIVMAE